jgi:hypothetical protein
MHVHNATSISSVWLRDYDLAHLHAETGRIDSGRHSQSSGYRTGLSDFQNGIRVWTGTVTNPSGPKTEKKCLGVSQVWRRLSFPVARLRLCQDLPRIERGEGQHVERAPNAGANRLRWLRCLSLQHLPYRA